MKQKAANNNQQSQKLNLWESAPQHSRSRLFIWFWHPTWVLVPVPAAPLLIWPLANMPGKAVENGPSSRALHPQDREAAPASCLQIRLTPRPS